MATREELYQALRKADAAGDVESASKLAAYIRALPAVEGQQKSAEQPKGTGSTALDVTNAGATGYNRGLLRLAGLPTDTMANVIDLVKAGVGSAYSAATDKAPPSWLSLQDRASVVGSGEWLIKQGQRSTPGKVMLDPANPEYEGGFIQNAGGAVAGAVTPAQAAAAATAATAAKLAYDATGNPALAVTAGMTPTGVRMVASEGAKRLVRGDEQGRRNMEQRVQDLREAGIDKPTLGLASGNPVVGGIETLLASTPGAVKVMRDARGRIVAGLEGQARAAAERASPNRGAEVAGGSIQRDIKGPFKDRVQGTYTRLIDAVDDIIGRTAMAPVTGTVALARQLTATDPNAPQTSNMLMQPRIKSIGGALEADAGGQPPQVLNSLMVNSAGQPWQTVIPGIPALGIPFGTLKDLRTKIGKEASSTAVVGTPEQAEWKRLYGAMTDDMRNAARSADQNVGPQRNNRGPAERGLERANTAYRAGMNRLERVEPFAQTPAPERAYTNMLATTRENTSTLRSVKRSVTPETRSQIAGTVIDRLGRANPGAQNELSDVFSPETFLTNWNRMTPAARRELFSGFPNADKVRAEVEAVAKATSFMRESGKLWANPSGTAANVGARATIGAGILGAALDPFAPFYVGGGLAATNLAARGLTGRNALNWAMDPQAISANDLYGLTVAPFTSGSLDALRGY